MSFYDKFLEPAAGEAFLGTDLRLMLSMAISLKRIADKLEQPSIEIKLPEGLHHEVTNMAWEAGRNFKHGSEIGRG